MQAVTVVDTTKLIKSLSDSTIKAYNSHPSVPSVFIHEVPIEGFPVDLKLVIYIRFDGDCVLVEEEIKKTFGNPQAFSKIVEEIRISPGSDGIGLAGCLKIAKSIHRDLQWFANLLQEVPK